MKVPSIAGMDTKILSEIIINWFDFYGTTKGLGKLRHEELVFEGDVFGTSKEELAYSITQNIHGDRVSKLIYHIFRDEGCSVEHYEYLKAQYLKKGWELDSSNQIDLIPTHSVKNPKTKEQMKSWLKDNAPKEVYAKILEAYDELGNNHPDNAIEDCRQAFEKLITKSLFKNALNQMVGNGLITKGAKNWVGDFELLKNIYDYISNTGVHTKQGKPRADQEQAQLTLMLTESALWYIIHILNKAKDRGIQLDNWVSL